MFIFGLALAVIGVLAIVAAVTTTNSDTASFLGFDGVSTLAIFLIGLGSGLAIMLGYGIIKFGTKRTLKNRREQKRLNELSDQLDRSQSERRNDDDEDRPSI